MRIYKRYLVLFTVFILLFTWILQTPQTNAAAKVAKIKQTYIQNEVNSKERSVLKGYTKAGKLVWTYKTDWAIQTELQTISPYFKNGNMLYIVIQSKVIALNYDTGKVLWKTKEIAGASVHYAFDKKGILYISGADGPDLVAIDKKGKMLWRVTNATNGKTYWPIEINLLSNKVEIVYENNTRYIEKNNTYQEYIGKAYVSYSGKILEYKEEVIAN